MLLFLNDTVLCCLYGILFCVVCSAYCSVLFVRHTVLCCLSCVLFSVVSSFILITCSHGETFDIKKHPQVCVQCLHVEVLCVCV